MRNSGSQLDDTIEQALRKDLGGVIQAAIECLVSIKTPTIKADNFLSQDGSKAVSIDTLAEVNIQNLATGTLPATDPGISGRIWNDGGVLKVSP